MRQEFTLRTLHALSNQLNADISLMESDWREIFYAAFDMNPDQKSIFENIEHEDSGRHHRRIQKAFTGAAVAIKNGGKMRLRVYNDPDKKCRQLRLEVAMNALETEPSQPDEAADIICCCADCSHWHRCGKRPNPCK